MTPPQDTTFYRFARGLIVALALYQGVVPVVIRFLFDGTQRFAPVSWLPSPWWWITALAVVVAATILLAVIERAKAGQGPDRTRQERGEEDEAPPSTRGYDALSAVVCLIGIYNGVAPLVVRLILDRDNLLLALPLRLPDPWWWITSIAVIVVAILLLAAIDVAKQGRRPDRAS